MDNLETLLSTLLGDAAARGSRNQPVAVSDPDDIAYAGERTAAEPSEAQREAGNYRKGHLRIHGLDISIETPKGSIRRGTDRTGKPWEVEMPAAYGYIRRTKGADGDHLDVFVGDKPDAKTAYVINQVDPDSGRFDELKVVLGADSASKARRIYASSFSDGRGKDRIKGIGYLPADRMPEWVEYADLARAVPTGRIPT